MIEDMSGYPMRLEGGDAPMVRFRNVTKRYGPLVVLNRLDLDVSTGEMVTIIGPSGSGKTTVLRMLMTLEAIDGGVIYVDGEPLTHMERNGRLVPANPRHVRRIRSRIGMCFQHFNLFPHMTALGNCMEGPVQVLGLSRREAEERSMELLDMVGLAEKRDEHPSRLSGGQQQRVAIARALDACGHPALLLVDTVSSLGSMPYEHDEWGVDVTVAGSQKGLMLPPGLGFNAVSEKAWRASAEARLARSYWDWRAMDAPNAAGYFPFTPATNLLFGLREAVAMLEEEGLERVFERHRRLAGAARRAVQAWGLDFNCRPPEHRSASLTAVRMPDGWSADALRALVLERFDVSLGNGLGKLQDRVFRIGHLGDLNDVTVLGTLAAVEMGLSLAGAPFQRGGVDAAMDHLAADPGAMPPP